MTSSLHAASCCGGGASTTSLITNNDKSQFTTSLLYSSVQATARTDGKWQKFEGEKIKEILTLEGVSILSDRTQIGVSAPFQRNSYEFGSERVDGSGIGDVKVSFGYEAIPEWTFSRYRPKVYVYTQLQLPTGRSIYDTQSLEAVDSTGMGLWGMGIGSIALKSIKKWDFLGSLFIQKLLDRDFNGTHIKPGEVYQASLGAGFNLKDWRIGTQVMAYLQDSGETSGSVSSKIPIERYVSSTLLASYMVRDDLSVTASYSDQTLVGKPINTQLTRGVFLSLQKRWER